MGKLGVGVGDEFPVDEPQAAQSSDDEWRAQRREWKAQWRARRQAFKADIRRSLHENFGPGSFTGNNSWVARALIAIGLGALAIAVLPFLFLLGAFVAAVILFAAQRGHHHHHDDCPTASGRRAQ